MNKSAKIYIAGHRGLAGSAIVRKLTSEGYTNLLTRTRNELDLLDQTAVAAFFQTEKPDYVFLAAAKVGGIHANNTYPAQFIYENLTIQNNIIHQSYLNSVQQLLFLGSSCIYPKHCPQPMKEKYLLSGHLEPTNEPYAIAKIAGIKLCESYNRQYGIRYRAVMPTNLYGPNDNFDLQNAHVLPAMIRKFHLAKLAAANNIEAIKKDEALFGPIPDDIRQALNKNTPKVKLWGTGTPKREFLHADDMADACLLVMQLSDDQYQQACTLPATESTAQTQVDHINVGSGTDLTIRQLAAAIKEVVGFAGDVIWNSTKPDGTKQKLLDITILKNLNWSPQVSLEDGLRKTYSWYLEKSLQP